MKKGRKMVERRTGSAGRGDYIAGSVDSRRGAASTTVAGSAADIGGRSGKRRGIVRLV